jgi:hypothetical protein
VTWWAWTLLWVVLLAGAVTVILLQARSLWRKAVALVQELSLAADRLDALDRELATLAEHEATRDELAVFADPARLRQAWVRARGTRRHTPHQPRHRATVVRPTEPGRATLR